MGIKATQSITKHSGGWAKAPQLNVLDLDIFMNAKNNPGKYPGIVVRVAGYCAYFDDLPSTVKKEIIDRTRLTPN